VDGGLGDLDLLALALCGARLAPIGFALASFGSRFVPAGVAASLVLALAMALAPLTQGALATAELGVLVLALIRELCIGGVFAVALALALLAVPWALRLAHVDMPPALATLYGLASCWLVLALGGARALLLGIAESYRDAPVAGTAIDGRAFALGIAQLVTDALVTALGVGLPLLTAGVLLELLRGLTVRIGGAALQPVWGVGRPLLLTTLAALLLVPTASQAPVLVRAALEGARALTRTLVR
jgi:flagellar biosynthesis protein FliR